MTIHILHRDWEQSAKELLCSVAKEFPKRKTRQHELLILSCYIDLDMIVECVNALRSIVRLRKVKLAFDFSEIYKHGPRKAECTLRSIQDKLGDSIQFNWKALASAHLMHGKAYSLVQTTRDKLSNGVLLVTKEIRELFRNVEEQIRLAKKSNIARKKFLLAKEHGDSARIRLTTEEKGVIKRIGRNRK